MNINYVFYVKICCGFDIIEDGSIAIKMQITIFSIKGLIFFIIIKGLLKVRFHLILLYAIVKTCQCFLFMT